jgi:hypothetical protein
MGDGLITFDGRQHLIYNSKVQGTKWLVNINWTAWADGYAAVLHTPYDYGAVMRINGRFPGGTKFYQQQTILRQAHGTPPPPPPPPGMGKGPDWYETTYMVFDQNGNLTKDYYKQECRGRTKWDRDDHDRERERD